MKNKELPKITIVTPSYNQGKFLERTILSVINQNYPNLQYFIIDGKSTDNSVDIIKRYEGKIDWWVSRLDNGQSDAINKGFKKATGDLLCWVNADDILFPGALEKVAEAYMKNPFVDIITGNVVYIDENDYIVRCIRVPKMRWFFYKRNVGYFTAPAVFFKRDLYTKIGGLDISLHYSMDVDMWHKFRLLNAKVYHVNDYLGAFRVHSSSKSGPRMKGERQYFEHPETKLVRERYLPNVSKNTVRFFRIIYKVWQIVNLNYLKGWLDIARYRGAKWQEIFF